MQDLIQDKEHEKIAQLEGEHLNAIRAVAYIQMGNFKEALKHADKRSFEMAYALYKLRKYKKALRILKDIKTEGSDVLSSQCLYYLGYYNTAYEKLSKIKKDDDVVVSLQAMKSMALLANGSQHGFGNKFMLRKMDREVEFEDLSRYKMSTAEGYMDFVFNLAFESLVDEDRFVEFLEQKVGEGLRGTMVEQQLRNVKGDIGAVDMEMLSKAQKEVLDFNRKVVDTLSNPVHFQKNFMRLDGEGRTSECLWIEEAYRHGFQIKPYSIPELSPKMMLFRLLVLYKNGYSVKTKRYCDALDSECDVWMRDALKIATGSGGGAECARVLSGMQELSSLNS